MPRSAPPSPSPDPPVVLRARLVPCWDADVLLLFLGTRDAAGRPATYLADCVAFRFPYN